MKEKTRMRIAELEAQLAAVPRVDPEAWKTPLETDTSFGAHVTADGYWLHGGKGIRWMAHVEPKLARSLSIHLASYAQAHGAPVDIGTQPAPIADAETLEALAELGCSVYHFGKPGAKRDLPITDTHWPRAAAAILRAARPRVDVSPIEADKAYRNNRGGNAYPPTERMEAAERVIALCNSRIRYGVELPPEPPATTAVPTDAHIGEQRDYERERAQNNAGIAALELESVKKELAAAERDRDTWTGVAASREMELTEVRAELSTVTAERDELQQQIAKEIDKHREYIDLEVEEKKNHYTRLRAILECDEAEHWMDAATRLVREHDDLRRDIDNAVKNAMERLPDFPWKDKTATEAVWGLSLAVKGGLDALDDLRRQLAKRTTRPVKVRFDVTDERIQTAVELGTFVRLDIDKIAHLRAVFTDHAVIDMPPGVPTVQDIAKIIRGDATSIPLDAPMIAQKAEAICAALFPYLQATTPVPPGVPTLEELAELIYSHVRTGRNYATSEPELIDAATAIRDAVLAGLPTSEPAPAPLSVEQLRGIVWGVCGSYRDDNDRNLLNFDDTDIPDIHAALLPYLRGPGECQECAAAKRAVQIERDGVNALAARIAAARAALEGET